MTGAGEEFYWYSNITPKNVSGMVNQPVYRDLPRLQVPTLVVFGEADQLIPNRYLSGGSTRKVGEKAQELIPNSQLVMVEKAGHFVMYEQAEKVNTAILKFLE